MKRKGTILLETVFAMIILCMAIAGISETAMISLHQTAALKDREKANQYAEMEADIIRTLGVEKVETMGLHPRRNMQSITGQAGNWESTATLTSTATVGDATVKYVQLDVYKAGQTAPQSSLTIPLSSQMGMKSIRFGTPNYKKAYLLSSTTNAVVPKNGYINVQCSGTTSPSIYINSTYCEVGAQFSEGNTYSSVIPVGKGDVISLESASNPKIYYIPTK